MKKRCLVALVLITLLLVACNTEQKQKELAAKQAAQQQALEAQQKEQVTVVAERFARLWEQGDFGAMYDFLNPELHAMQPKEEFISRMKAIQPKEAVTVRLDKISFDDENTTYAYYSMASSGFEEKVPAIRFEKRYGKWRVNAFAGIMLKNLTQAEVPSVTKGAKEGDTVSVYYTGALLNGQVFDSSINDWKKNNININSSFSDYELNGPLTFKLGAKQLIEGFDFAVRGMEVGDEQVVQIPPNAAYGLDPKAHPLGNQTLRFKILLIRIE